MSLLYKPTFKHLNDIFNGQPKSINLNNGKVAPMIN
jgi:hypothetical protein